MRSANHSGRPSNQRITAPSPQKSHKSQTDAAEKPRSERTAHRVTEADRHNYRSSRVSNFCHSPASVVKEIVENAIDAGAIEINISIERGSTRSIRVQDNGSGISANQVATAISRHATSNLLTDDDPRNIATLGFRGEALPSIAAASRLTCVTKTADHDAAVRHVIEFGVAQRPVQCGAAVGTSIRAENLFGYQPARLKFLHTHHTEAAHVQRTVPDTLSPTPRSGSPTPPRATWCSRLPATAK